MAEDIERKVIDLIAADRIDIPVSSMSGKLKRMKPKLAEAIQLEDSYFEGERVYARAEAEDIMKARGMSEAVEEFSEEFPRYGSILKGKIEEKRAIRETHLYFGVREGCRLTSDDYMTVMKNLGFTEKTSKVLYPALMDVSRDLASKRRAKGDAERRILVG